MIGVQIVRRIYTDLDRMANLELNIEFAIRTLPFTLEQTNELRTRIWLVYKLNTVVKWNCKHDIPFLFHTIGRWTFRSSILNWRMNYHAGKHVAVTLTFYIYCCLQHDLLLPLISQEFIGVNETWWHCSCYLAKDNKSENSYKSYL